MSDVYKFRVTVDLELATHVPARLVRDHLKTYVEEALASAAETPQGLAINEVVDAIHKFNVRTKRLDDWASIDPPTTIRIAEAICPKCETKLTNVVVHLPPLTCPVCHTVIPIDANGRTR